MSELQDSTRSIIAEHEEQTVSYGHYIFGFVASLALTLTAYVLVTHGSANRNLLVSMICGLAVIQFLVQMFFFLHLGEERGPRWKLLVAVFMVGIVLLIVFGSVWIMNNLNYRMTPEQMNQYLKSQDSL
jgi:cytochrome o ubiquinol oxidase operon protein cyoD